MKRRNSLLLLLLLWLGAAGCDEQRLSTLRVAVSPWPGYDPLVLALEEGMYGKVPVKIIRYSSTDESFRALRDGAVDAAALTLEQAVRYGIGGFDPRVFLLLDLSLGGDALVAREARTPAELAGKRVGMESGVLARFFFNRFLEENRLSPERVEAVIVETDDQEEALRSGRVDAVVTYQPVLSALADGGGHILFDSSMIPGEIVDVLVTRKENLEKMAPQLRAVVRGWFRILAWMEEHPEEAYRRMGNYEGVDGPTFQRLLEGIEMGTPEQNREYLASGERKLDASVKKIHAFFCKERCDHPESFPAISTGRFLGEAVR